MVISVPHTIKVPDVALLVVRGGSNTRDRYCHFRQSTVLLIHDNIDNY